MRIAGFISIDGYSDSPTTFGRENVQNPILQVGSYLTLIYNDLLAPAL